MGVDEIYRAHLNDIYSYLFRLTRNEKQAEDLAQDTFFRAFQYLDSYHGEKVRPWLFKVAYHAFIDWQRKQKRQVTVDPVSLHDTLTQQDAQADPEQRVLDQELWTSFSDMLGHLPDKQRQVLLLRCKHQLTYEEIAAVLDIPASDVKAALYRGRQKLRTKWRESIYGKQP